MQDAVIDELLEDLSEEELDNLLPSDFGISLSDWIAKTAPKEHWPIPPHLEPLIQAIERAAREPIRLLVSMPPRHGKTETIISGLSWFVHRFPNKLNAYATYAANRAKGKSRKARRTCLREGIRFDEAAASVYDWRTLDGGGLICGGRDSGLTGEGVDGLLVVDDPFKGPKEANSELVREEVWDWYREVVFTRLNPGSSCIIVQTRWHDSDLIGKLVQAQLSGELGEEWEYINIPAIRTTRSVANSTPADEDSPIQIPLWPTRFPMRKLRSIRKMLGPYAFSALYQGRPVPKGGRVFGNPARWETLPKEKLRIVMCVDAAGSAKTKANQTAAVVIGTTGRAEEMKAYLLEVLCFRKDVTDQAQLQEAADKLFALQQRWGNCGIGIEKTRDGEAIYRALKFIKKRLRLYFVTPMGDKFTRAQPVASAWNDNRFLVPLTHHAWLSSYLQEMSKFTGVNDVTDDQVDATAHAWNVAAGIAPIKEDGIEAVGNSRWGNDITQEIVDRTNSWG